MTDVVRTFPLIVCERTGKWASAWRRTLADRHFSAGVQVVTREVRSVLQIAGELVGHSIAAIAIEAGIAAPETLLQSVAALAIERGLLVIVLAELDWLPHEAVLLEAGAAIVVYSPRNLAPAAEMIVGHAKLQPTVEDDRPYVEAVYDRLPWPQFAKRTQAEAKPNES